MIPPGIEVRRLPSNVTNNRLLGGFVASARYPTLFLGEKVYEEWSNGGLSPLHESYVVHELDHTRRQQAVGLFWYTLAYILSPHFRFFDEMKAIRAEMKVRKAHGLPYNIDHTARALSGHPYHATSYDKAHRALTNLWREVR